MNMMIQEIQKLLIGAAPYEENCKFHIKELSLVEDAEQLERIVMKLYAATVSKELRDSGHEIVEDNMSSIYKILKINLPHEDTPDLEKKLFWAECFKNYVCLENTI